MHMLARVEGMPLGALAEGVPWDWRSFGEYLDRSTARSRRTRASSSATRRSAASSWASARRRARRPPTTSTAMRALLDASLAAGGMGFSSSWARTHNDAAGDMVPSRYASEDEILALCSVVREHPGTTLEFIPCVGLFEDFAPDLLTRMSLAANRPINWNVLFVGKGSEAMTEHNLAASDYATEHGARVLALDRCRSRRRRASASTAASCSTRFPGWEKPMALPHDEKKAMLASADGRNVLREAALQPTTGFKVSNWGIYVINETFAPENKQWEGKTRRRDREGARRRRVRRAVRHRRRRRSHDRLRLPDPARRRRDVGSAHEGVARRRARSSARATRARTSTSSRRSTTRRCCSAARCASAGSCRSRRRSTSSPTCPARLYGLKERGRLAEGWHADVVVIDPETVGAQPVRMRFDLPTGAPRLYGGADGIDHVHRERRRDRRPRRVHRRAARARCCARAATPRRSPFPAAAPEPHADGAAPVPRPGPPARAAAARPGASRSTSRPGCPNATSARVRDVIADLLRLHDTMTQRAEAAAVADAYLTLSDDGRRNFLRLLARDFWTDPARGRRRDARAAARATTAGPRERRLARRARRRRPTALLRLFTGLDGGVKFLVDLRADVLRVGERRRRARRSRPRAQGAPRDAVRRRAARRCAASRGTRRPRCSRSSSRTRRCTRSARGTT